MPMLPDVLIGAMGGAAWRDSAAALAAALGAGSILLGLWNHRQAFVETTLIYAAWWSAAACAAIAAVEFARVILGDSSAWISPLRFCAAALTFCPIISVLGSKRPQHVAWNFVVFSLWGIVSLSALTALVMQRSERFVLGDSRGWLLWALILIGLANYLPTRNWPSALIVAAGQALLFASHLPIMRSITFLAELRAAPSLSLVIFAVALMSARIGPLAANESPEPLDRLWLDFRDLFGLLWGLRLQERVNAAATAARWDLELTWRGFVWKTAKSDSHHDAVRQSMTGLLRRFVSHEWIASRLGEHVD